MSNTKYDEAIPKEAPASDGKRRAMVKAGLMAAPAVLTLMARSSLALAENNGLPGTASAGSTSVVHDNNGNHYGWTNKNGQPPGASDSVPGGGSGGWSNGSSVSSEVSSGNAGAANGASSNAGGANAGASSAAPLDQSLMGLPNGNASNGNAAGK